MMSLKALSAAGFLGLLCVPAQAGCYFKNFDFHPENNDSVLVEAVISAGTFCTHNFGEGPGYRFTSISPLLSPEHGVITNPKRGAYTYTPAKDFHGKDAYAFKVCAVKQGAGKGCSTIYYVSTTQ